MTLTKADLVQQLTDQLGLNRRESADMVEAFFEEIARTLEAGRDVKLSGFGCFTLKQKAARPGRNPKTGVESTISARRVVTWHPSPKLKSRLEIGLQSASPTRAVIEQDTQSKVRCTADEREPA